jgi:hypothetical protein
MKLGWKKGCWGGGSADDAALFVGWARGGVVGLGTAMASNAIAASSLISLSTSHILRKITP